MTGNRDKQMQFDLTLGEQLQHARERMDLNIADVAYNLRISAHVIERIEEDGYAPEEMTTFVRGYIRAYAKLVGLSEETIDQAFQHLGLSMQHSGRKKPLVFDTRQPSAKDKPVRIVTYGVIAVLIVLVLVWRYTHYLSNKHMVQQAPPKVPVENVSVPLESTPMPPADEQAIPEGVPAVQPADDTTPMVATQPTVDTTPTVAVQPMADTTPAAATDEPAVQQWADPDAAPKEGDADG